MNKEEVLCSNCGTPLKIWKYRYRDFKFDAFDGTYLGNAWCPRYAALRTVEEKFLAENTECRKEWIIFLPSKQ